MQSCFESLKRQAKSQIQMPEYCLLLFNINEKK